jgi:DNA-directed RNA polymerase subunit RPC12/RpoP
MEMDTDRNRYEQVGTSDFALSDLDIKLEHEDCAVSDTNIGLKLEHYPDLVINDGTIIKQEYTDYVITNNATKQQVLDLPVDHACEKVLASPDPEIVHNLNMIGECSKTNSDFVAIKEEEHSSDEDTWPIQGNLDLKTSSNTTSNFVHGRDTNTQTCKTFPLAANLKTRALRHTGGRQYTCDVCGKLFSRLFNRTKHMKVIHHIVTHKGEQLYKCPKCDETFKHIDSHRRHLLTHTKHIFKCSGCDKHFLSHSTLKQHTVRNTRNEIFTCPECSATFKFLCSLRGHLPIHRSMKPFTCSRCGDTFKVFGHFHQHMVGHSNHDYQIKAITVSQLNKQCALPDDNKQDHLKCTKCDKRFTTPADMDEHMSLHVDEKPCVTTECGNDGSSIAMPSGVYHTERSRANVYVCSTCDMKFKRQGHLKIHTCGQIFYVNNK